MNSPVIPHRLGVVVDRFEQALLTRVTPGTAARYRREVALLLVFAIARTDEQLVERDLDLRTLRAYLAQRSQSPIVIAAAIKAIRRWFRWMRRMDIVEVDVAGRLCSPQLPRPLPVVVGVDAAAAIMRAPNEITPEGLRDRAILETLYGAGISAAELVGLELGDMDLVHRDGSGKVLLRGLRARAVPIGGAAVRAVGRYIRRRPELAPRDGTLFVGRGSGRLSQPRVRRLVRLYGLAGAGRPDVTPRVLRASFAAHLLDGGADLSVVQRLLGHRRVSTTLRYLDVAIDHLIRVYDLAHPLAMARGRQHLRSVPRSRVPRAA